MFKRLVASLKFPFLLLSFDILRPPNDAWLATSAKTGRESGEELVKITSVTCASWSPCSELENWPLLSYYRVCDHALTPDTKKIGVSETGKRGNKLHWDRSLGSWLRQSPPSLPPQYTFLKPADKRCETLSPLFRLSSLPVVETFQEPSSATGNDFARYWGWG